MLLKPVPYPHPEDLYIVRTRMTNGRFTIGLMASEEMTTLERQSPLIETMAMGSPVSGAMITVDGDARQVVAYGVWGDFFRLSDLPTALGRGVAPSDTVRGAPPVVVLSHARRHDMVLSLRVGGLDLRGSRRPLRDLAHSELLGDVVIARVGETGAALGWRGVLEDGD